MMGRTIKIYLTDGTSGGIMTAEIINWTGKFIVSPRSKLAVLAQRNELKQPGIYFLVGHDPEMVYIGESDNVWERLKQHNSDPLKDFWDKAVIVTSKDTNLTKAHVGYLETKLIKIVREAGRAQVVNVQNSKTIRLPESDVSDMEFFLAQIQMLLPVLGFTFALPLPNNSTIQNSASPVFYLNYDGAKAEAREVESEFIVLKGSTARKRHTDSLADTYIRIRETLREEGKLVDSSHPEYWEFTQDVPFLSPSTAAKVVSGASLNGRQYWKVRDTEQSYAAWQEEQIKKAENVDSTQTTDDS